MCMPYLRMRVYGVRVFLACQLVPACCVRSEAGGDHMQPNLKTHCPQVVVIVVVIPTSDEAIPHVFLAFWSSCRFGYGSLLFRA